MNDKLLKLEAEQDEVKQWLDDLRRRLREPQGAVTDKEWVIMLHKKHALEKHYSCVLAQYEELKKEQENG